MIFLLLILFIALLIGYIGIVAANAKVKTERAPRVPMFTCDRHGTIPAKYAIPFDGMGALETPVLSCPMCYEDRMKEAMKTAGVKKA